MIALTSQQIEVLKSRCSICSKFNNETSEYIGCIPDDDVGAVICKSCNGTGLPTIEIKKEMVECLQCNGQGGWYTRDEETGEGDGESCQDCKGKGEISKWK